MKELCKTPHLWRVYPADEPLFQCRECQALGRKEGEEIALVQCVECGGVATDRTIRSHKIVPICESCCDKSCVVHRAWSPFRGRQDWFACDRCGHFARAPAETLASSEGSGAVTDQAPGMSRTGITSTASPGKIAKCGWFSKSFSAASFDSARTTVKAPSSLLMSSMPR